ncbi:hypothetical protein Vadar_004315 [Vaccinium darrowii]|uniref:Uncharacterized protein n=1 Tax=Vaccinium darrowii TaxID=229202 RepID=A0ACB7Z9T7_9ERIC|nr:hypothetical protein Vadar_004315 [Vaccinium darrowii]
MERHRSEEEIKKGPWTAEEDEVLLNFVNKYGPRDWSSIRSMGLLPRTGKSCRLRWVNKLRPNLKMSKFSTEEERVVIDLQARFGNKWASIASYLPGRTDNDVKNFWSSRQKRLARILQSPPKHGNSQRNKGKAMVAPEIATFKAPEEVISPQMEGGSSSLHHQSCSTSSMGDPQMTKVILPVLPDLMNPNLTNIDSLLTSLDIIKPDHKSPSTETPFQLSFNQQLPTSKSDELSLLPGNQDSTMGLGESNNFLAPELENVSHLNFGSPFLENEKIVIPDSFFDELPADMFDYLEQYPSSSSSL